MKNPDQLKYLQDRYTAKPEISVAYVAQAGTSSASQKEIQDLSKSFKFLQFLDKHVVGGGYLKLHDFEEHLEDCSIDWKNDGVLLWHTF